MGVYVKKKKRLKGGIRIWGLYALLIGEGKGGGTKGTYKENNFLERKIVPFREWMGDRIVLRQCLF